MKAQYLVAVGGSFFFIQAFKYLFQAYLLPPSMRMLMALLLSKHRAEDKGRQGRDCPIISIEQVQILFCFSISSQEQLQIENTVWPSLQLLVQPSIRSGRGFIASVRGARKPHAVWFGEGVGTNKQRELLLVLLEIKQTWVSFSHVCQHWKQILIFTMSHWSD